MPPPRWWHGAGSLPTPRAKRKRCAAPVWWENARTCSPVKSYQYTSGAVLQTPVGYMTGSYQMRDDKGEFFDAEIPTFTLSAEVVFH